MTVLTSTRTPFKKVVALASLLAVRLLIDQQNLAYLGSLYQWGRSRNFDEGNVVKATIASTFPSYYDAISLTGSSSIGAKLLETARNALFVADMAENTKTTSQSTGPFRFNSKAWLNETKISNRAEDVDFIWSQILDVDDFPQDSLFTSVTERSVCHADSSFRKASTKWNVSDKNQINEWTFRLTYLAMHSWHHAPAADEARARREYAKNNNNSGKHQSNDDESPIEVQPFDFECPNTKFLIASVLRLGMGATYRLGVVNSLLAGIATNRVTVFLNNIQGGPGTLPESQWLASCDRQDMQCSFLPITPCTVTREDLMNRTLVMPEGIAVNVRKRGHIPDQTIDNARYVYMQSRANNVIDNGLLSKVRRTLVVQVQLLLNGWRRQAKMPREKVRVLVEALRRLESATPKDSDDHVYPYGNRDSMIHHVAILYLLRLQRDVKEQVDDQVTKVLSTGNFDASKAIGLPIRGSDKCFRESTCLPFEKYTKLAHEVWSEHFVPEEGKKGSLLITTEASDIANASRHFESEHLSIVMNGDDVLQDTGRPRTPHFRAQADKVMESSLVALKLQLHAKHVIGNCCSNFHLLLFDLLRNGCGLAESQQCLQETKNPEYHVCCQWTKSDECDIQFGRQNATVS